MVDDNVSFFLINCVKPNEKDLALLNQNKKKIKIFLLIINSELVHYHF